MEELLRRLQEVVGMPIYFLKLADSKYFRLEQNKLVEIRINEKGIFIKDNQNRYSIKSFNKNWFLDLEKAREAYYGNCDKYGYVRPKQFIGDIVKCNISNHSRTYTADTGIVSDIEIHREWGVKGTHRLKVRDIDNRYVSKYIYE